jgi:type IV secretory pathway VirB2 component (pilin)
MLSKFKSNLLLVLAGVSIPFVSSAGVDIGTSGNTGFATIEAWLQSFVDFMDGPGGLAVVVVSIIAAVAAWMFAPRDGVMGPIFRVVVGAIVIINVGTWVTTF